MDIVHIDIVLERFGVTMMVAIHEGERLEEERTGLHDQG